MKKHSKTIKKHLYHNNKETTCTAEGGECGDNTTLEKTNNTICEPRLLIENPNKLLLSANRHIDILY